VYEHLDNADAALDGSHRREHERTSAQVQARGHDNAQAPGEDDRGERAD
jgi:hypothetical protein